MLFRCWGSWVVKIDWVVFAAWYSLVLESPQQVGAHVSRAWFENSVLYQVSINVDVVEITVMHWLEWNSMCEDHNGLLLIEEQ